ncbi:hypothetical protein QYE76_039284 [Lolium multiflorum]|uniref:RNase H type-1 domain-containing protein n=1 Tax=Lolium multiflorum TaxID=4521 RepID=A0AAD8WTQ9_LOLMU|nr:hypothetical protein QYE76_039284 [Lolium multiflorum]
MEPMLLYIAATNRVVSIVLVVERKEASKEAGKEQSVQRPVYYLSEVLSQSKQNYPHYQKVTYGVYMAAKKLKHYFQEHPIKVVATAPLAEIIGSKDANGRVAKWALELAAHTIIYEPRTAIKSQILADFFVDWAEMQYLPPVPDSTHWKLHFDGSKMRNGLGAGIVVTSPKGDRLDYVLQIHFAASNNVAEYEALIHGLKLAKEIGVRRILCLGDSDLVIQQASGDWDADTSKTKRTPDEAEELLAKIGRNHDDWTTPEPTPTPILKKRGLIKLNDEDMREAKKSLKEKGIKSEDVKNLPPIEDICEIIPPSSMIEDPLYPEGHPKRIEQDSQRIEPRAPSKKKKKKHKNVVESSEPVNDPNSISISDAETESGNEHDNNNGNDKNDVSDKEEVEDEPEKQDKNKKYTKEDFIAKKHGNEREPWVQKQMPFPAKKLKSKEEEHYNKFCDWMKPLFLQIPLTDAIKLPPYSKYMKDIVTNKRKIPNEEISTMLANYSFNGKVPKKLGDPDKLIPTDISLQMADKSTAIPVGICEDVPVQVTNNCLILTDFVVLEMPEDDNMSIILGRPFLNTAGAVIDCNKGKVTFNVDDREHTVYFPKRIDKILSLFFALSLVDFK